MSKKKKGSQRGLNPAKEKHPAADSNRALIKIGLIIGILLFALAGFGAVVSWRSSTANSGAAQRPGQPLPTPPQYAANAPAKEYIYAGSKLLAVSEPVTPVPADLAVWRPSSGTWYVLGGPGSQQTITGWGLTGDIPAPGDFDGDGKTDFSVFRPSEGKWYIIPTTTPGSPVIVLFGLTGDIPAPADFNGDGMTDYAVFRPSTGYWHILRSGGGYTEFQFGITGDVPAPADYDGDGKADISVWRQADKKFYSLRSSTGSYEETQMNSATAGSDVVSADYDGDGKADHAVYQRPAVTTPPTIATWHIRRSTTGAQLNTPEGWGLAGDIPVQNDYDADGKVDIAIWRNTDGHWHIRQSASGDSLREVWWGLTGDIPVPAFYRR